MWHIRGGLGRGAFVVFYVGLVAIPLLMGRLLVDTDADIATSLASGLGIAAFVMLLAGFWLTGRFQIISARAGLDRILVFHRYSAVGALVLLVAHIATTRGLEVGGPSPAAWIAFALVVAIALMAFGRSRMGMNFEVWRYSHGIAAVIVALAGFAHATSDGIYSSNGILVAFWATLVVVAIGSLVWIHAVRPARKSRHPYRVVSVAKAADKTWTVGLEPDGGEAMDFVAGQYAFVSFGKRGYRHPGNPFSFSSAPSQRPQIEFTIKENGDLTDEIGSLAVGSSAYLDGPLGFLSPGNYRGPKKEIEGVVLIAGGVGIGPMMSILREARERGKTQPIKLLYGARSGDSMAYVDDIEALKSDLNLETHYVVSEPASDWPHSVGRLDSDFLARSLDAGDRGRMFFVCGSTGLVDAVLKSLDSLDLATPEMVHAENFSIYD